MFTAAFHLPLIPHSTLNSFPLFYCFFLFAGFWDFGEPCLWQVVHWTLRPKYIKRPRKIYWGHSLFRHRLIYASMASARTIVTPRMPFVAIRTCSRVPLPPFCPAWTLQIARYVKEDMYYICYSTSRRTTHDSQHSTHTTHTSSTHK